VPVTVSVEVPKLLRKDSVALTGPAAVGVKATVSVQLSPGASAVQFRVDRDTSSLVALTLLPDQGTVPVLVSVTVPVADEPTVCSPKSSGFGLTVRVLTAGATMAG
jgi:hypothetical protein